MSAPNPPPSSTLPHASAPAAQKRPSGDITTSDHDAKRLKAAAASATTSSSTSFPAAQIPSSYTKHAHATPPSAPPARPPPATSAQRPQAPQPFPHTSNAQPQPVRPAASHFSTSSNNINNSIPVNGAAQASTAATSEAMYPLDDTFLSDPEGYIKGLLLPILDQVALSVIEFATRCSVKQLLEIYENPSSHTRRALDHLHSIFLRTRENFMTSGKYLDVAAADRISSSLSTEQARQAYRNTNMASAIFILLIPTYQTMKDLQFRLAIAFEPLDQFLRADNMELAAGLLTQIHQSQMREASYRRVPTTDEPLSRAVENNLVASIRDDAFRAAFWQRCQDLRHYLMNHSLNDMLAADCRGHFLRNFRGYLRRYLDPSIPEETSAPMPVPEALNDESTVPDAGPIDVGLAATFPPDDDNDDGEDFDMASSILNAARLAQEFMKSKPASQTLQTSDSSQRNGEHTEDGKAETFQPQSQNGPSDTLAETSNSSTSGPRGPTQAPETQDTTSTSEQYERAREEVAARAREKAAQQPPPTSNSSRRPWTKEEEQALMHGLDRVKGPHWSQILAMYGPGGSVSEVLKERNQVQLKDKARNIKLFFLKQGHPVPPYLQDVTGELKTRAPARERKNEFGEQLQRSSSEDKATMDAINALSGANRDNGEGVGTQEGHDHSIEEDASVEADVSDEFKKEFEETHKNKLGTSQAPR